MNIFRATIVLVPLLVVSSTAFADSEDKKQQGAMEPQTPIEEPKAEETTTPAPSEQPMEQQAQQQPEPAQQPIYTPPPAAPPVGTTTTTAYERVDVVEKPAEKPAWLAVGDLFSIEPLVGHDAPDAVGAGEVDVLRAIGLIARLVRDEIHLVGDVEL